MSRSSITDVFSWLFFTTLILASAILYIPLKLMSYPVRLFKKM